MAPIPIIDISKEYFDEDCIILDGDPHKPVRRFESQNGGSDELLIVAEKGQVACRDYPHARYLCARFPFTTNPHQKYCDMCHCFVCDSRAPCVYWGSGNSMDDHCHSTDKEESWRLLRQYSKQGILEGVLESKRDANTVLCAATIHPEQRCSQPPTINEHSVVFPGINRLSGIVKWFNRGYGFIIPESGEDELFIHQSSIITEGYRNLAEGEAVEFEVRDGEDGRKTAINVTGPSVVSVCHGCYNVPEASDTTECDNLDNDVANSERLTGIVKWYNKQRGIGYITPDNGGKDLFVWKSSINKRYKTLTEGEEVEFQIRNEVAIYVGEVTECYSCWGKGHLTISCPQKVCHKCGERGHLKRIVLEKCYRCDENGHLGSGCPQFVCYKCGAQGHFSMDCTQKVCDKCNQKEHLGSDCPPRMCRRCNERGHWGSECPQFVCYKCKEQGHFSMDCTVKVCHVCSEKGHTDNNCPRIVCYKCMESGHYSMNCTQEVCYRCSEKGHSDNNCPRIVCCICDEPGHFARNCTQEVCCICSEKGHSDNSCPQIVCYICDEPGHFARDCTQNVCCICSGKGHLDNSCPQIMCYICNEVGHFGGNCIREVCHNCSEKGHNHNNCPRIVCYICNEAGHFGRDCTRGVPQMQ